MAHVVWITGYSSGIGAALAASVPDPDARVIGVSRRPGAVGEHVAADLTDPAEWDTVLASFDAVLGAGDVTRASLLHFAGIGVPHGPAALADRDQYRSSVLLNSASGQVLAQGFLGACAAHGITDPLIILCSSPAAITPLPFVSHYGAGKKAGDYWVAGVAAEEAERSEALILGVAPFAVDTPMLRSVMDLPAELDPNAAMLRAEADQGRLATPEATAAEIWAAAVPANAGSVVYVGAVPPPFRDGATPPAVPSVLG